jgi:hypothetical protein
MVIGGMAPEVPELRDVLDRLGNPVVVTLAQVIEALRSGGGLYNWSRTGGDLYSWLSDPKNRRTIPHRLVSCGYVEVLNSSAESGLWCIAGKRQMVYGRKDVAPAERLTAARKLKEAEDLKAAEQKKKFEATMAEPRK